MTQLKPLRDLRWLYRKPVRAKSAGGLMRQPQLYIESGVRRHFDLSKYYYVDFDIQLKIYAV